LKFHFIEAGNALLTLQTALDPSNAKEAHFTDWWCSQSALSAAAQHMWRVSLLLVKM